MTTTTMRLRSSSKRRSFDRFGDDLTQLLLSDLTFEDKLRFQCVSKQWQQLLLQSVTRISCTDRYSDLISATTLAKLLPKCPNIRRIRFPDDLALLPLITRYCRHLKHIYINQQIDRQLSVTTIDKFFTLFADQLQTIHVWNSSKNLFKSLNTNLKKCTNISTFKYITRNLEDEISLYRQFIAAAADEPMVYQKLNKIKIFVETNEMLTIFEQIVRLYGHQLKSMAVLVDSKLPLIRKTMTGLSQIKQLIHLKITILESDKNYWQTLVQLLPPIGRQSYQLKRLSIIIRLERYANYNNNNINHIIDGCDILNTISNNFKQLKRLYLSNYIDLIGSNNKINGFKQLTHLTIYSKKMSTTDHFIDNIAANCPRLQCLVYSGYCIDSKTLKSLIQLSHLHTISLKNVDNKLIALNAIKKCLNTITSVLKILKSRTVSSDISDKVIRF
ncbi:uncharacterized protein LOC128957737 [Oppia nitens]|uniref:uncharacterized protein LOC128957737 n=1 Tax=Oppia nitens TaxID=1686743 RepID=UPI0023D99051|nr:uncharacterized protein LOC128957737 [Oppia nitens]